MATISKQFLSGSTNGRNIKIAASASAGTLVHTAHASDKDEVWLWATNTSGVDVKLTIEWGGTTAPDDHVEVTIPAEEGDHLVIPGKIISGGLAVRAFAATANVINVSGYVNRITA